MNKTELNRIVKHYTKNKDPTTAINYIKSFGSQIDDYDVEGEIEKIKERI